MDEKDSTSAIKLAVRYDIKIVKNKISYNSMDINYVQGIINLTHKMYVQGT